MKKIIHHALVAALSQLICVAAAAASDKVVEKPIAADTTEKFTATVKDIREEMQAGGRYEYMKPADKARADTDLNSMTALFEKSGSVAAMSQDDRLRLFNTQEELNGLLTHNDSNRLVCERRAPVGTNIPTTKCKTAGEVEKERRDSQKYMQDQDRNGWKCHGGTCAGQ